MASVIYEWHHPAQPPSLTTSHFIDGLNPLPASKAIASFLKPGGGTIKKLCQGMLGGGSQGEPWDLENDNTGAKEDVH